MTPAAGEPYPAPAHTHPPSAAAVPGGRAGSSAEHPNSRKHHLGHPPAARVLLSAEDVVYRVCNEKQHLLQDFPMCINEVLINEGQALWREVAADTFRAARSEMLLGFFNFMVDNFHSSQKRYCPHHEVTLFWISLGWVKMN